MNFDSLDKLGEDSVVFHREMGLHNLYLSKVKNEFTFYEKAIDNFIKSLEWGAVNPGVAQENIQIIVKQIFKDFSLNKRVIPFAKLQLTKSLLTYLGTILEPGNRSPYFKMFCEVWVSLCQRLSDLAADSLFATKISESETSLEELKSCIECTEEQVILSQRNELRAKLAKVVERTDCLQVFKSAKKLVEKANDQNLPEIKKDTLQRALAKLQEAEFLVPLGENRLRFKIQVAIGLLHFDLKARRFAQSKFEQVVASSKSMTEDDRSSEWFTVASKYLEKMRMWNFEEENRKRKQDQTIKEIILRASGKIDEFVDYILKHHPPFHIQNYETRIVDLDLYPISVKSLQKLLYFYHTDKGLFL